MDNNLKPSLTVRFFRALGFVPARQKEPLPKQETPAQEFVKRTVDKLKRQMQPGGRWGGSEDAQCPQTYLLSPIDFDLCVNKSLFFDFDRLSDQARNLNSEEVIELKKELTPLLSAPLGKSAMPDLKNYHQKSLGIALKEQFPDLAQKMTDAGIFTD